MNIQLSEATAEQLPVIRDLAYRIWPGTFKAILSEEQISYMLEMMYSIPSLERQVTAGNNVFLLAKDSSSYVGFASYELNYKGSTNCKLHKIYVLPDMQGKNVGRVLMEAIKQLAISRAQHAILLNVNRHNNAVGFYRKYGFTTIGEEDIDIGNGYYMNDFIMELLLPSAIA